LVRFLVTMGEALCFTGSSAARGQAAPVGPENRRRSRDPERDVSTLSGETRSAGHGKAADSEHVLVEDYHCSGRKVFSYLAEVGEDDL
jgi:hypothetical protein